MDIPRIPGGHIAISTRRVVLILSPSERSSYQIMSHPIPEYPFGRPDKIPVRDVSDDW